MRQFASLYSVLLLVCFCFVECKKDNGANPLSVISVSLRDAPASFDQVNVEVTGIEIHSEANGWLSFPVRDSIYNLLLLQGGNAAYLTNAELASGTISGVKLVLGTQNNVVSGGTVTQLLFSDEDHTGLTLDINHNLIGGTTYNLSIDFKTDSSIIDEGNGVFRLKPVMSAEFLN